MTERPESSEPPERSARPEPENAGHPGDPEWLPDPGELLPGDEASHFASGDPRPPESDPHREQARVVRRMEDLRNIAAEPDLQESEDFWPGSSDRNTDNRPPHSASPYFRGPPADGEPGGPGGRRGRSRWLSGAGGLLVILLILGILVPMFALLFNSNGAVIQTSRQSAFPRVRARVLNVLDGNTIQVQVSGRSFVVRYIGVDIPAAASRFHDISTTVNQSWVEGRFVELEADGRDADPEGRLLRYVWVNNAMVNAALLAAGLGTSVNQSPNDRYSNQFMQLEENARSDGLGIWTSHGRGA